MTIAWHRDSTGTGTTTVTEGASKPGLTRYSVVDRTERQAVAAIKTAMRRNAFTAGSALVDHDCPDCPPGRPCWCTAESIDTYRD